MASIYDVNAAIDKPNLLGSALAGLRVGNEQRALREQRADAATLRGLAPAVMAGEAGALEQAAAIDPAQAAKFQAVGDIQAQKFRNWFTYTDNALQAARKTGNLASVNAALQAGGNFISQMTGKPAPTQWTPDMDAGWEQLRAKVATLGAPANPDVKVVGDALVDETGRVVYQGTPQAKYFQTDQGLVMVGPDGVAREVRLGGGGAAPPANVQIDPSLPPDVQRAIAASEAQGRPWDGTVPEAGQGQGQRLLPAASLESRQRLELSQAADRRAEEAAERARQAQARADREAQLRQQFGAIPPGYRVNAAGTALEMVPGAPVKAPGSQATEGERKAATLLQRLNGSLAQMQAAIREDSSASSPSVGAEIGRNLPLVGEVVANVANSPERQRVEAAQLDILDAALTLGTGAAYTREQLQGYRRAFFPQIGDSQATIADKAARLENVISAARIAAGRAAPPGAAAPASGAPARPTSDAEYNALPSGALFVDPDDGQTYRKP